MKKQAALLLAAVMSAGTVFNAYAAGAFADINDVPWGGAQAYINSVYENGIMVGDINSKGERVFRARDNISYNETVQLVYMLSGETATDDMINKWAADMKNNGIPKWAYGCVSYGLENGIITRTDIAAFMNYDGSARFATREDTAYIFGRFLASKGAVKKAGAKSFADKNKISAVCLPYAELLSSLEIMIGDENSCFNPNKAINRAEMAVMATKTDTLLKDMKDTPVHEDKQKADYSGFINNVTDTSLMLYTFDGKSIILDKARDSQYYLDGKAVNTRGIYSLTSNGILVKADIFVNSSGTAMEIYCTRSNVEGKVSGLGFKSGEYKRGSNKIPYAFYTVTMTYANGLSRSYRLDENTDFYYDDKEIDIEDFQELIGKALPVVDVNDEVVKECLGDSFELLDVWDEDDDSKYLNVYGVADTEFNDEYYVYPQARLKELRLRTVMLETAVISAIDKYSVTVLDENGYEYEYKLDDGARFYIDGEKERITDFKKAVRLNYSTVELRYDTDGYVTRISAETYK